MGKGEIKTSFSEREAGIWNAFQTSQKIFKQNFQVLKEISVSRTCIVLFYMGFSFQVVSSIHMFSNIDIQIYIKIRYIKHFHIHWFPWCFFFVVALVFDISNFALETGSIYIVDMNSFLPNQDQCFNCLGYTHMHPVFSELTLSILCQLIFKEDITVNSQWLGFLRVLRRYYISFPSLQFQIVSIVTDIIIQKTPESKS